MRLLQNHNIPLAGILVGLFICYVKHDDGTLSLAIPKPSKLLLTGCVPDVETNWPSVGVESEWVDFYV